MIESDTSLDSEEKKIYIKEFLRRMTTRKSTKKVTETSTELPVVAFVLKKSPDYDVDYLERIVRDLKAKVRCPIEIVCLADINVSHICKWIELEHSFPRWWPKLELFSHSYLKGRKVIYFDLDTIITGDITELIEYDHDFSMLRDFYFNHRFGSGVMAWNGDRSFITEKFMEDPESIMQHYKTSENWGDQAFIRDCIGKNNITVLQDIPCLRGKICSYKVNKKHHKSFRGSSIVCFHGTPRPREVGWRL